MLLDPSPEWVRGQPCKRPVGGWAPDVVQSFLGALDELAKRPLLKGADAGTPRAQPGALTTDIVGTPIDETELGGRCVYRDFRATLWRPLLAAWPESQADVSSLAGSDVFHRGLQAQVVASAVNGLYDPLNGDRSVALWGGLGVGVAFATQGIFPHRGSRSFFELNGGFAQGFLQGFKPTADVSFSGSDAGYGKFTLPAGMHTFSAKEL